MITEEQMEQWRKKREEQEAQIRATCKQMPAKDDNIKKDANGFVIPVVGMGATYLMYSDRHPYTVIEVKSRTRIVVQEDHHIRVDKNGAFTEQQDYEYFQDKNGRKYELSLTKNGWKLKGQPTTRFGLGYRREYYDYSF